MFDGAKYLALKTKALTAKLFTASPEKLNAPIFTAPPALTTTFASSATSADLTPLPISTANPAIMSFLLGIPPEQGTAIGSGGVPANLAQMNGALQFLSQYIVWSQAGGQYTWQQAIVTAGGYNQGAILFSPALNRNLISLVNNNVATFAPDGVNWQLFGASVNDVHAVGDYKYSEQVSNHASGIGMWLVCNGQSYSTLQYPALFALIGYRYGGSGNSFNVPNLTDSTIAMASPTHIVGTVTGANSYVVPVPYHTHGLTAYNAHTHGMTAYNGHTHNNTHTHNASSSAQTAVSVTDNGHAHVINVNGYSVFQLTDTAGTVDWQGGKHSVTQSISTGSNTTGISVSASTAVQTSVNNYTGYTGNVYSANYATDAVNYAGTTDSTDGAGTNGIQISAVQPTVYVQNAFIYAR